MRTPFKMKSSPTKGRLDNFFKGLGKKGTEERQKKQVQENQGMTNFEKRQAEKAAQRKTGKSKFQRAGAERKARKAATQEGNRRNAEEAVSREANTAKIKAKKVVVNKPKTKVTGALGSKTRKEQYDAKGWKYDDTIKGYNRDGTKKKKR